MAVPSLRWMKPVRTVMNTCVNSSSKIMMGPHTKLSTASMTSSTPVAAARLPARLVKGSMKNEYKNSSMMVCLLPLRVRFFSNQPQRLRRARINRMRGY